MKHTLRFPALLLAAVFAAVLALACLPAAPARAAGGDPVRLAGYYICFEEGSGAPVLQLRQGILTISDGIVSAIGEYRDSEPDTLYLEPSCVILPGLLDLHSHIDYNNIQLWISEEAGSLWDNRFEWRASEDYKARLADRFAELEAAWEDVLYPGETPVARGDLVEYFTELQAASGGTTLIQGSNNKDTSYDAADSHEKIRMIRSTALPEDLGREGGLPVTSMTQIYLPDAQLIREDPYTYLPPADTSFWNVIHALNSATGQDRLEELLEGIAEKTGQEYLINLAEGRAGYLALEKDAYSRLEFDTFKQDITAAADRGLFTPEDVKNAHIGLIHACAVDLADPDDAAFLKEFGIGLIWSPVSNLLLYSDTPDFFRYMDGKLRTSSICFDSPAGTWKVSWQILSDGKVTLAAEVPSGASAHIVLPDHPEGLETDVESGSYEWTWTPEVDYLHPFSIDSRMMDLLDNPETAKIVKEHVPALYNACGGHDNDMRVLPPMQVAEIIPLDRDAIRRMDSLLRKVAI